MGMLTVLVGRNSSCKASFLQAASASDKPIADTALETQTWFTTNIAPRQGDLVQAPANGFSPKGERLLPTQLKHTSVADIAGESKDTGPPAILLVVAAEVAFFRGRPRPSCDGLNPVTAAVARIQGRLGSDVPFAVAVSIDTQEAGGELVAALAKSFLASVREDLASGGVPVVAVSPRTELWLREQEREGGRVSYRRGDSTFRVRPGFEQVVDKNAVERARNAFDVCGGTGILAAVSVAVQLRSPTLVFSVGDFDTLQSSGWEGDGPPDATLRTCRVCHARSTPRDVFAGEKADGVLSGELRGAEVVPIVVGSGATWAEPRVVELDAPIGDGAWLLRLTTNRKPAQLRKGTVAAAGGAGRNVGKALAGVQFGDLRSKERRRGRIS